MSVTTETLPRWNAGQEEDPRPGYYYATVRQGHGAQKVALLAGPYDTHGAALDAVRPAKRLCEARYSDRDTAFAEYGTCRLPDDYAGDLPVGKLNDELEV